MIKKTEIVVDRLRGDGISRSFLLTYKIASRPLVRVGDEYIHVGLKGVSEYHWYYVPGEQFIIQNNNDALLTSEDSIDVIYIGEYEVKEGI